MTWPPELYTRIQARAAETGQALEATLIRLVTIGLTFDPAVSSRRGGLARGRVLSKAQLSEIGRKAGTASGAARRARLQQAERLQQPETPGTGQTAQQEDRPHQQPEDPHV